MFKTIKWEELLFDGHFRKEIQQTQYKPSPIKFGSNYTYFVTFLFLVLHDPISMEGRKSSQWAFIGFFIFPKWLGMTCHFQLVYHA